MCKNIRSFLAFFLAVGCCIACGKKAGLDGVQKNSEIPKTEFTKEDFLADYDQLWTDLEENYIFFEEIAERGVNLERLYKDYRDMISQRIESVDGFAALLRNLFHDMGNIGHLELVEPGDISFLESYPEVETAYYEDVKAVYFHFRSFGYDYARDRDVVADYLLQHEDAEHVIFDITGNKGGLVDYWIYNIVAPFGGETVWEDYSFLKKSPMNEKFIFKNENYFVQPLSELPEGQIIPAFVQELGLNYFISNSVTLPPQGYEGKVVSTKAKRWVLIDRYVYSAADRFAYFCKKTDWAVLVGETTAGGGANGPYPFPLTLGRTGLLVRFYTTAVAQEDGSMHVTVGTTPDICSRETESPLRTCLDLVRRTLPVNSIGK